MSENPTSVITVRMPPSMHDRILAAARYDHTSMNTLCNRAIMAAVEEIEERAKRNGQLAQAIADSAPPELFEQPRDLQLAAATA